MIVAILAESKSDDAILRVFVDEILGVRTTSPSNPPRTPPGWHATIASCPVAIRGNYYGFEVDGLVTIVDTNGSPIHTAAAGHNPNNDCRLCRLRQLRDENARDLAPVPGRNDFHTAIGVCTPAVEAWLVFPDDSTVTEAAWGRVLDGEPPPFSKDELKRRVYGSMFPDPQTKFERGVAAARRAAARRDALEGAFPAGFGHLARELRRWSE